MQPRRGGRRRVRPARHARERRLGLQRPARPDARRGRRADDRDRGGRGRRAAARGRLHGDVDGEAFAVEGRDGIFAAVTDFVYAPRDATVEIAAAGGGRFALPSARAANRLAARHVSADEVEVELRGAGQASRQINNFCGPDVVDRRPAHRRRGPDAGGGTGPPTRRTSTTRTSRAETALEEIYYFEVAGRARPRLPARVRLGPRPGDRRHGRGPLGRRDHHAPRLPRPLDGRARLRPLLPQRDGRSGGARVAVQRRSRARMGPRDVGGAGSSIRGSP